jgi:cytochrome c biogenesis protein CcdA
MNEMLGAVGAALWLGLLTSVSPCPMATNIAAVSFLGKRIAGPRAVLVAGALYTLGRMLAYTALSALLVAGASSVPGVSNFLQTHMNRLLGPLFLVVAVFLLELVELPRGGGRVAELGQKLAARGGALAPLLLGALFALAFCPISAALFFGSLLPLAVKEGSVVLVPVAYGLGTALPVLAFALVMGFAAQSLGRAFAAVTAVEKWARLVTGLLFLVLGIYFTAKYVFGGW